MMLVTKDEESMPRKFTFGRNMGILNMQICGYFHGFCLGKSVCVCVNEGRDEN